MRPGTQKRILCVLGGSLLLMLIVTKQVRRYVGPPAGLVLSSGPSFFFSSGFLLFGLSLVRRPTHASLLATTAAVTAVSVALELGQPLLLAASFLVSRGDP